MTSVELGPLTPEDAERCAELEAALFAGEEPWSAWAFLGELAAGHHYLAARRTDSGRLVGYAGVALLAVPPRSRADSGVDGPAPLRGVSEAEVHTIGVDPGQQGHGVGRRLLRGLLDAAEGIDAVVFLEVRTDNEAALALYRSEGFEVVGTRRRYYASGADAYTMRRPASRAAVDRAGFPPRSTNRRAPR